MRGCVAKDEDGSFTLQPQRGLKVKLNSTEDLSKQIGHEVKVSGSFTNGEQSSNTKSDSRNAKLHPEREFRVLKLDTISQACKLTTAKKK